MADDLRDIIRQARANCPEVPEHLWSRIESSIRQVAGGRPVYIQAQKKGRLLDALDAAADLDDDAAAAKLGVTVRHIRRLRRLR